MPKYRKVKRQGQDVVVFDQELTIQIPLLRKNLEAYKKAEADAHRQVVETEEMISEVEAIAPELLAAADKAQGRPAHIPVGKNRSKAKSARKARRKTSRAR